jgi:hypothetical protein
MAFLKTMGRRPSWLAAWCAIAISLAMSPEEALAQTPISAENQVKAVFLFNFAQFLAWPQGAFPRGQSPIVIGVLGEDPFGSYLDRVVQGEKIGDRRLVVRRYAHVEDVADCHILFISRSEAGLLDKIIERMKGRSLLTVGDLDGFTRKGGMVGFSTENGKIRLKINVEAAKAADLTISSRLLAHATIEPQGGN